MAPELFYGLGALVLLGVLFAAFLYERARRSRRTAARTEAATRRLYDQENREETGAGEPGPGR